MDEPNENTSNPRICRGGWGESATSIDLRRPGDVQLVLRAIANGWDVPQAMCDAICDQLDSALEFYRLEMERRPLRAVMQFIKLVKLFLAMEAENALARYPGRKTFPGLPRRRGPEAKRRPRRRRRTLTSVEVERLKALMTKWGMCRSPPTEN